jgi:DNA-binding beta-propeller fold protein YncE
MSSKCKPGLYDGSGVLLASVSGNDIVYAVVFGQGCTLQIDVGGETMTVTKCSDREENCSTNMVDRANQIKRCTLKMKTLQGQLAHVQTELEEIGVQRVGEELVELIKLRGKQKAKLDVLGSCGEATVPIKQTVRVEAIVLVLDKLYQLSFFSQTVMYRKIPLQAEVIVKLPQVVELRTTSLSAWQSEQIVGTYEATVGSRLGSDTGYLNEPYGVDVSGDNVFVSNHQSHTVSVYRRDGSFVRTIGSGPGSGNGQLNLPTGIAVAGEQLFVADRCNDRVCVFSKDDGAFVRVIGDGLGSAEGLAVSGNHLFVTECYNHRVSVFSLDGGFIRHFGSERLVYPRGVAVAGDLVFVTDTHYGVSTFSADGSFVRVFGSRGSIDGFFSPFDVAVAGDRVFVADWNTNSVLVYQLDGKFVRQFGNQGVRRGQLCPWGIAVADGRVYVSDVHNHRVQVFI